jgi:hypothetical protein
MVNATLIIDTNGIVKKLEQRGFSRTQAEGITDPTSTTPCRRWSSPSAAKLSR